MPDFDGPFGLVHGDDECSAHMFDPFGSDPEVCARCQHGVWASCHVNELEL